MTEQQWFTSTNPVEMHTFIKDKVTERQQRFFVEACRANAPKPWNFKVDSIHWGELAEEWCSRMVFNEDISASDVCDLLREIIGNPFHRYQFEGEFLTRHDLLDIGKYLVTYVAADLLTWNNGAILNLARAITEEECLVCKGSGCVYCGPIPEYHTMCVGCKACNDAGHVLRAEPQWNLMPVLADALEEAGCTEAAILNHLRGTERCEQCCGTGALFLGVSADGIESWDTCKLCIEGKGKRPVWHVKGCWVLELLSQKG